MVASCFRSEASKQAHKLQKRFCKPMLPHVIITTNIMLKKRPFSLLSNVSRRKELIRKFFVSDLYNKQRYTYKWLTRVDFAKIVFKFFNDSLLSLIVLKMKQK